MPLRYLPIALVVALTLPSAAAIAQDQAPPAESTPAAQPPMEAPPAQGDQQAPASPAAPVAPADTRTTNDAAGDSKIPLDEIRRYVAVYKAVKAAYVEPVEDHDLMQSAIQGLLLDLDPHSAYLEGDAAENFDEQSRGNYDGIGVEIFPQPDGTLRVIAPIDGTPAARAGIRAGDLIVAVDGVPLRAGLDEEASSLRGEPGTKVELTVVRDGEDERLKITVERKTIAIASVRSRVLEPGYGYIRVSAFQADTAGNFEDQLEQLNQQAGGQLRGLVLDLRSNPGGLLTAAVQIADALLDNGKIVSTRGRIPISDALFSATPGDRLHGAPVVILVDAGSASASEVLAGALADNDRALVVGSRTFGKGSVQTIVPLANGAALKLTTARYYTPSGRSIQAEGIEPDVGIQKVNVTAAESSGILPFSEADLAGALSNDTIDADAIGASEDGKDSSDGLAASDYPLYEALNLLKGLHILRSR